MKKQLTAEQQAQQAYENMRYLRRVRTEEQRKRELADFVAKEWDVVKNDLKKIEDIGS